MKHTIHLLATALALFAATAALAQVEKPLPAIHVEGRWLVDTHGNHVVLHGVMDTPNMYFNGWRWGSPWSSPATNYDESGATKCLAYFEKLLTGCEKANCNIFRLHLDPAWTNDDAYSYPIASEQPADLSGEADIKHFNPTRLKNFMNKLYFPLAKKAMNHRQYVVMRPPGVCPHSLKVGDYYQKYLMHVWDIVTQNDSVRRYSGQIAIELANEPVNIKNMNHESDANALHDYFQPVVDVIRSNGFKGIIWVPGTGYQSSYADYKTHPITDFNFGYAVHVYSGWYGCDDSSVDRDNNIETSKKKFINQFHTQVPVVDTNPIFVSEVDWSPLREPLEFDHNNEWGQPVYKNLGTWATASTSKWGACYKAMLDHYGNVSMTLTHPSDYLDLDKLVQNPNNPVPAFDGNAEACSGACWEWYADYYTTDYPRPDLATAPVSDNGKTFTNPIVRADFPDPDVIRVGSTYYMVSTTMHNFPGATILKSQDLVNWEYCARPLQQLSDKAGYNLASGNMAYGCGMWACSMKYHNGKFYILINERLPVSDWSLQGWLLTATNPEGRWEMKKLPRSYYDPGMLFDGGKVYVAQGIGNISVCELDENFNFKREKKVISDKAGLEGCHFYKIGDYYYIYATYGGSPSGQTVFRSTDPFGPYEEKVLVEKNIDGQNNYIHQGALVEDVEGKWWTIMQEDLGALGRMPNLQPVRWKDDWPIVGNSQGKPYASFTAKITRPAAVGDLTVKHLPTSDEFRTYPLGMQWEWNHNPVDEAWTLFERPSWLRMKTVNVTSSLPLARNILTQRIFADRTKASTGTVRLDVTGLTDGDRAGICILQDPYAMLCVERTAEGYRLLWQQDKVRDAGSSFVPDEATLAIEPADGIVYLRASIKYGENRAKFQYSTDGTTWHSLGKETGMGFNLTVFVGARFGLFCYATKATGGYADFDWFSTKTSFDEAAVAPADFTAPQAAAYTATKVAPAKKGFITMVGRTLYPTLTATYADKSQANVAALASFAPATRGIVDFDQGAMEGIGQGTTSVDASYTDLLGNTFTTSFEAQSSYFPLDAQWVSANIVGQGNYKLTNGRGVFKFAKDNQMGWNYINPIDMSAYRYLVMNLTVVPATDYTINIYASPSLLKGAAYTVTLPRQKEIVIDLQQATYTSTASKGRPLNAAAIYMVTLGCTQANRSLSVAEMFLSNDSRYAPDGIEDIPHAASSQQAPADVRTLAGQLVRRNASGPEATRGLAPGLYVIGSRKVLVR